MKKTMTCKLLGAALMAGGLLGTSAQATVLIDFGRPDNETTGAADTYNNAHLDPLAYTDPLVDHRAQSNTWSSSLALVDTSNNPTGMTLNLATVLAGEVTSPADVAAAPAAISGFEQTAWGDSMFTSTGGTITVSITGLNDALTYDLLFYGSRGKTNTSQTWSITKGSGGGNVIHDSMNNTTTVVDWTGISTDGNGEIEFTMATVGRTGALNFGQIVEASTSSLPGDTDGDGFVDNGDLAVAISNFTGPQTDPPTHSKDVSTGDTDGDGAVDNGDLAASISNFTGPPPAPVPEPTSLALFGLGGLLIARRRRAS